MNKAGHVAMAIGLVLERSLIMPNAVKIGSKKLELDTNLLMYFSKRKDYWAVEQDVKCRVGDIVLIKELDEQMTLQIHHNVSEVIYSLGAVIDPITGRRCRGTKFIPDDRPVAENTDFVKNTSLAR